MHWAALSFIQYFIINVVGQCFIIFAFHWVCIKHFSYLFFIIVLLSAGINIFHSVDATSTNNEKTIEKTYYCNGISTIQITSLKPIKGFITSANYPLSYLSNNHCTFELNTPIASGLIIHLFFIDIDLKAQYSKSGQCLQDYIRFMITDREGREHVGPRYCGNWNGALPSPLRGMQSKLQILFVSSFESEKHRGFKIRFEFIFEAKMGVPASIYNDPNTQFQRECGGINDLNLMSGEIRSPGFPSTYPRDVTCNWLIRVEPHKRVYLRLLHLELASTVAECDRASLLIIDGYQHEVNEVIGTITRKLNDYGKVKYCGGHLYYAEEGMKSYLSTSNRVIIRFITKNGPSQEQVNGYQTNGTSIGFRLLWTKVVNNIIIENEKKVEMIDKISDSYDCDGGFMCRGGEFCIDNGNNVCTERMRLCINETLRCNGISNCAENDNSDEIQCYSQELFTLISFSSFVLFLILTLIVLTVRSFLKCKKHRQQLKNTFFDDKKIKNKTKLKRTPELNNKVEQKPPLSSKLNGLQTNIRENSNNLIDLNNTNSKNHTFCNIKKSKMPINISVITESATSAVNNQFKSTLRKYNAELKQKQKTAENQQTNNFLMLNSNANNEKQIRSVKKTTENIDWPTLPSAYNLSQTMSNKYKKNRTISNRIGILTPKIESTQFITNNNNNLNKLKFDSNNENDLPKCNCSSATDLLLLDNLDLTTKILTGDFNKEEINFLNQDNRSLLLFQSETESKLTKNLFENTLKDTQQHQIDQKNVQISSTLFKECNQIQRSVISSKDCLIDSIDQKVNKKNILNNYDDVKYDINNDVIIIANNNDVNSNVGLIVDDDAEPIWQLATHEILR